MLHINFTFYRIGSKKLPSSYLSYPFTNTFLTLPYIYFSFSLKTQFSQYLECCCESLSSLGFQIRISANLPGANEPRLRRSLCAGFKESHRNSLIIYFCCYWSSQISDRRQVHKAYNPYPNQLIPRIAFRKLPESINL